MAPALLQLLPPANTVLEHINAEHIAARMEQLAKQQDGYLDFEQHLRLSNELDDTFSRWVDDLLIRHKECLSAHPGVFLPTSALTVSYPKQQGGPYTVKVCLAIHIADEQLDIEDSIRCEVEYESDKTL